MRFVVFIAFLCAHFLSFAQVTYNISGHAYLEGEVDHSPLTFSVINPFSQDTLAVTSPDPSGFYSLDVSPGFYLLNWSHVGHIPQELGDFAFSTDTVLADVTLLSGYVQDACGEVSGVWPSGSVYDVLCDIEVPEGDTLTIESGTRVRFKEGTNMVCNGVLRVLGDPSDRVVFTSREPSPLPGDWGHVSLYAQGNTISHLDYEYANDGFIGDGASYTTIDNTVVAGNLSLSANGIYLTNSSNLTITNNAISVAGDFGVYSPDSPNSLVDHNDISGSSNGLYFGNSPSLTITNNTVAASGDFGVYSPGSPNSVVDNNTITGITDHGIYLDVSESSLVTSNTVTSAPEDLNHLYGITAHQAKVVSDNTIDFPQAKTHIYPLRSNHVQDSIFNNTISVYSSTGSSDYIHLIESSNSKISQNNITYINSSNTQCNEDVVGVYSNSSEITGNTIIIGSNASTCGYPKRGIYSFGHDAVTTISNNVVEGSRETNCIVAGHAVITDNIITGVADGDLGILSSEDVVVTGNVITNIQNGIQANDIDALVITHNTIASNATAISISNSDALVTHNLIASQGRGVQMGNQSGGEISNNTMVSPNSADYGIHISNLTAPVVQNNIIEGFANGIYAENDLQNYFIQNNNLWNISGDMFSGTAMPPLVGQAIDLNLNGDECDIYSNLNLDPLFVNPGSADYHLQETSPCINAGSEGSELDPDGTIADIGAFYYPTIYGCVDECACNYNASANESDGSCDFDCHGCIYASASNYDASATFDDGSCIFEGCMHDECVTYNELANLQPEGACDNPSGFADFDKNGIVQVSDLTDMLQAYAAADSDWNGIQWIQDACNGSSQDATGEFVSPQFACASSGCLYPSALNYNPLAIQDPGVCAFPGCTDNTATNYNVHANIEDGSCRYIQCPDFNRDGMVQITDLMDFLSVYGIVYE